MEIEYEEADYEDNGTGLSRELIFNTLFSNGQGYHESVVPELSALEEVTDVPEVFTVSSVEVEEINDSLIHIYVYSHDVSVGTQPERQKHSSMVLRDDSYSLYRVSVKAI